MALAGILTGVMVAVARVIGETAPLRITDRNLLDGQLEPVLRAPPNRFPVCIRPVQEPGPSHKDAYIDRAWAAAFTLIIIVMVLNLIARFVYRRFGKEVR